MAEKSSTTSNATTRRARPSGERYATMRKRAVPAIIDSGRIRAVQALDAIAATRSFFLKQ